MPLELNSAAGNIHLFKLSGTLAIEKFTLRKIWIWDVLEINWDNTHITLNEREINLPGTFTIPLVYKLKARKTIHRDEINAHVYHIKPQKVMVQPRKQTGLNQNFPYLNLVLSDK